MNFQFHTPASLVLLAGGLVACFAGYRAFRFVLGLYGFILGALFASSLVAPASTSTTAIAALVGGVVGAVVLSIGYFIGVALLGAGVGAMLAHVLWAQAGWGDPNALPVLVFAVLGSVLAIFFQRYVIIVGTAFSGAWMLLFGTGVLARQYAGPQGIGTPGIWAVNPYSATLQGWFTLAWLAVGILGIVVQLRGKK